MRAAVFAARFALTALATHHVITASVLAARLAMTAATGHVTAGLAARATALASSAAGVATVRAAGGAA